MCWAAMESMELERSFRVLVLSEDLDFVPLFVTTFPFSSLLFSSTSASASDPASASASPHADDNKSDTHSRLAHPRSIIFRSSDCTCPLGAEETVPDMEAVPVAVAAVVVDDASATLDDDTDASINASIGLGLELELRSGL